MGCFASKNINSQNGNETKKIIRNQNYLVTQQQL